MTVSITVQGVALLCYVFYLVATRAAGRASISKAMYMPPGDTAHTQQEPHSAHSATTHDDLHVISLADDDM